MSVRGPVDFRASARLALIFGLLVSTLFTLVVVPMIYYMAYGNNCRKNPLIS